MIELVVSDVDGVLTDGRLNIGDDGELFKSFDVKDGYGIVDWQREGEFAVVTSRSSSIVEHRAAELGITDVHQGVSDKCSKLETLAEERGLELASVAYIGDDVSDVAALESAGTGCCPADASREARSAADYVSSRPGGDGAVREVLDYLRGESKTALGVIPARYGSTRLPGKPLVDLAGKPMIQRVYERASEAEELDEVLVATDDERIREVVERVGGRAVMTASDHPTGTDRVAEVAREWGYDLTINVQGDEPLIEPEVIDQVVAALRRHPPRVATPISVVEDESLLDDENTVKVVTDDAGRALYFSRSRIPSAGGVGSTFKHIGLYGFETDLLLEYIDMDSDIEACEDLEQLRLLENGYDIQTVEVEYDAQEINVEDDIAVVEERLEGGR